MFSLAMTGRDDKLMSKEIDRGLHWLEERGLIKILSYHPKFLENGVIYFVNKCLEGKVIDYTKHENEIIEAVDRFFSHGGGKRKELAAGEIIIIEEMKKRKGQVKEVENPDQMEGNAVKEIVDGDDNTDRNALYDGYRICRRITR